MEELISRGYDVVAVWEINHVDKEDRVAYERQKIIGNFKKIYISLKFIIIKNISNPISKN